MEEEEDAVELAAPPPSPPRQQRLSVALISRTCFTPEELASFPTHEDQVQGGTHGHAALDCTHLV